MHFAVIAINTLLYAPISRIFDMNTPKFRVTLPNELLPVQAFFNALPDAIFLDSLEGVLSGVGVDYNGVGCVVPGEADVSAPETGILFYVGEEELWLPNLDVIKYLKASEEAYVQGHPDDENHARAILELAHKVLS